ncbi:MAG: acetaldehyde dehydrogenase (acetylating) [Candidatus Micrarchaeota archaeon]
MDKTKVAILGTGNIGCDLLAKVQRSDLLECSLFVGRRESPGLAYARSIGVSVSTNSLVSLKENTNTFDILFDATNAEFHLQNDVALRQLKKFIVNLTPSKTGELCVPVLNLNEVLDKSEVNLISCGGQATIPIAYVVKQLYPKIEYIENVTAIASKSAGPATRLNIDNYVQTTQDAICKFSGVKNAKVILNINPAIPPINMHNTTYVETSMDVDIPLLALRIKEMVKKMKHYIPGYNLFLGPIYEDGVVTIMNEIVGRGDYLPAYAGNLDIITCAAVSVAEERAKKNLSR